MMKKRKDDSEHRIAYIYLRMLMLLTMLYFCLLIHSMCLGGDADADDGGKRIKAMVNVWKF